MRLYSSDPATWAWMHEVREDGSCATCERATNFRAASGGRVPVQTARAATGRGSRGSAGTNLAGSVAPSDPTCAGAASGPLPAESVFEPDMGARGFAVLLAAGLVIAAVVALWVLGVTVGIPLP